MPIQSQSSMPPSEAKTSSCREESLDGGSMGSASTGFQDERTDTKKTAVKMMSRSGGMKATTNPGDVPIVSLVFIRLNIPL